MSNNTFYNFKLDNNIWTENEDSFKILRCSLDLYIIFFDLYLLKGFPSVKIL